MLVAQNQPTTFILKCLVLSTALPMIHQDCCVNAHVHYDHAIVFRTDDRAADVRAVDIRNDADVHQQVIIDTFSILHWSWNCFPV